MLAMRLRQIRARKLVWVKGLSERSGMSETNICRLEQRKG